MVSNMSCIGASPLGEIRRPSQKEAPPRQRVAKSHADSKSEYEAAGIAQKRSTAGLSMAPSYPQ